MATDPSVIDISHYQPDPDWTALKAAGVIGVIFKATQGTVYIDPTFAKRRHAAWAADFLTSSYHFLEHGEIAAQMAHYLATVAPDPGERVVIDFEDDSLDLADLETAVECLMATDKNLQITIYGGHKLKELVTKHNVLLAENTSLWLCQYTSGKCSWPSATWPVWSLWQYADTGQVPGIKGNVDINRFNGEDSALRAWLAPAGAPVPAPHPDVETVTLTIGSPKKIRLVLEAGSNVELSLG
jgi:lysozyme